MNNSELERRAIAMRVIVEILDRGLADSTWRNEFPKAYRELLEYRLDLEGSVIEVLQDYEFYT